MFKIDYAIKTCNKSFWLLNSEFLWFKNPLQVSCSNKPKKKNCFTLEKRFKFTIFFITNHDNNHSNILHRLIITKHKTHTQSRSLKTSRFKLPVIKKMKTYSQKQKQKKWGKRTSGLRNSFKNVQFFTKVFLHIFFFFSATFVLKIKNEKEAVNLDFLSSIWLLPCRFLFAEEDYIIIFLMIFFLCVKDWKV